jgi:hypothetical protein
MVRRAVRFEQYCSTFSTDQNHLNTLVRVRSTCISNDQSSDKNGHVQTRHEKRIQWSLSYRWNVNESSSTY